MDETSPCPICGEPVPRWERYPGLVCSSCVELARDVDGRPMRFLNETMLGTGFVAEVEDEGRWRPVERGGLQATCWVQGRRCVAAEHRFGGVVVQVVAD